MGAPVDAARSTSGGTASGGTPFNINQPTVASGDMMIVIAAVNGTVMGTQPVGFTSLFGNSTDGTFEWVSVGYRVCDGSEGATTTATANVNAKFSAVVWKITGADTSVTPIISTMATASSTTPNPTAATGASHDWLWVWAASCNNQPTMPPTGQPTGYSNPVGVQSGGSGGASSKTCSFGATKQALAATTEDPSSWTISTSSAWGAFTVGVAGISAGWDELVMQPIMPAGAY